MTGHTYSWFDSKKVDPRLEQLSPTDFDGYWLGGDVLSETTLDQSRIDYLDGIFDLKNPMTHIAYGNHDVRNGNVRYLNAFRNRSNSYYTYTQDGLCFLILDTTLDPSDCSRLEAQWQLIQQVTDTISKSSHLILLMHDAVWENVPGLPFPSIYANGSQTFWNPHCGASGSSFANSIYPLLVKVKSKGVEVISMMGDSGWKRGGYFISDDGIHFLASGINETYYKLKQPDNELHIKDRVLIFTHQPKARELTWTFVELDSLPSIL